MIHGKKIIVVRPAYNAEKTLEQTYAEIPFDIVDAKRFEAKTAWYQRLFKRKPAENTNQASEPTSEAASQSNAQSQ